MAFVEACDEVCAQSKVSFDQTIVAVGSGGTIAGLANGDRTRTWRGRMRFSVAFYFEVQAISKEARRIQRRTGRRWP